MSQNARNRQMSAHLSQAHSTHWCLSTTSSRKRSGLIVDLKKVFLRQADTIPNLHGARRISYSRLKELWSGRVIVEAALRRLSSKRRAVSTPLFGTGLEADRSVYGGFAVIADM